jgi:hypothetical protein
MEQSYSLETDSHSTSHEIPPHSVEPESLLLCLPNLTNSPYPGPDEFRPYPPMPFPL